jgi:hypothetical protein
MKRIQKPLPPHSNLKALLYIWSIIILALGSVAVFVFWSQ